VILHAEKFAPRDVSWIAVERNMRRHARLIRTVELRHD
jgi:hypothetical protein